MSQHPSAHPVQYRPDIDGLRAIAVTAVVLHHAFPDSLHSGFVGVDIFFVISGYLITSIILRQLEAGRFSFADFYARRIKRIFPALLLVLGSTLVAGWYLLTAHEYRQLGKHVFAGATFLSNFAFWQESGYFDASAISKPLLHLWSLAIEEQFYIFWPLLLYGLVKLRRSPLSIILGLLLASFALNLWLVRQDLTAAFYNPAARFWEMMMGAMLAAFHANGAMASQLKERIVWFSSRVSPGMLSTLGLLLLALIFWKLDPSRRFPGWWAFVATLATCMLIAAGPSAWFNRYVLASKPFVWIGLISYPLYLWHWPIMSLVNIELGQHPPLLQQLGWILLAVLLATLTYLLIERPIRTGRWHRTKPLVLVMSLSMLLTGAIAATIYTKEIKVDHLPQLIANLQTKRGEAAITEGWRNKDCMLDFNVPPSAFKPFCTEEKRPLVFLWGDSHAASLYPGLKALQDSGKHSFGITERTGAICPPVLGIEPRPGCRALNDHAIDEIRRTVPDIVILYAWWHEDKSYGRYDITGLEATVEEIRKAGVPRIILMGAVPYWKSDLPRILLRMAGSLDARGRLPLRLGDEYLDPHVREATAQMRTRAQAMGIEFISGLDYFCNQDGCLSRLNESAAEPLSYDYGHLSLPAVTYFVEQISPLIFRTP